MTALFDRVEVSDGRVDYRIGDVLRSTGLVTDDLWLDYGALNLTDAPQHVVTIPGLLNLAPVVWFAGIEVSVPFRDAALEEGLGKIRARFREMYPQADWAGSIVFDGPEVPQTAQASGKAMLFSGGLDSVTSVTRHVTEGLTLITVGGADMASDDLASWDALREDVEKFAVDYDAEAAFVRGNIKECLNTVRLSNMAPLTRYGISYWGGVQHGLALSGLTAPVAWAKGVGQLYLASTHTEDFDMPWGSGPTIDNHIAWSGFRVIHDGFDTSRQQKLGMVVEFCEATGKPRPRLRVCVSPFGDRSKNCGRCEKCLRTQAGLLAEGEDPRQWGFDADPAEATEQISRAFASRRIDMKDDELFMWADIHKRAVAHEGADPGLRAFMVSFDPAAYRAKKGAKQRVTVPLKTALSRMPWAYRLARRAAMGARHRKASR